MVRHCQLAIGAFDLDLGGRAGDAKHLVVVAFSVVGQKSRALLKRKGIVIGGSRLAVRLAKDNHQPLFTSHWCSARLAPWQAAAIVL
jgi:hypothetical protein